MLSQNSIECIIKEYDSPIKNKNVRYDIIYVLIYTINYRVSRTWKFEWKRGDEIAMEIKVRENRKGQFCKNRPFDGHWQHWANKTPDEGENERIKRTYQI